MSFPLPPCFPAPHLPSPNPFSLWLSLWNGYLRFCLVCQELSGAAMERKESRGAGGGRTILNLLPRAPVWGKRKMWRRKKCERLWKDRESIAYWKENNICVVMWEKQRYNICWMSQSDAVNQNKHNITFSRLNLPMTKWAQSELLSQAIISSWECRAFIPHADMHQHTRINRFV